MQNCKLQAQDEFDLQTTANEGYKEYFCIFLPFWCRWHAYLPCICFWKAVFVFDKIKIFLISAILFFVSSELENNCRVAEQSGRAHKTAVRF